MQNFQIMSDVSFYKHKKWSQKWKNGLKIFCYSEFKFMRPAPKRESSNLTCETGHPWSIRLTEFSFNVKIFNIFVFPNYQDYDSNFIYPREDETYSGHEEEKRSFHQPKTDSNRQPKSTSHQSSPIKTLIAVLRTTAENVKEIGRYYYQGRLSRTEKN